MIFQRLQAWQDLHEVDDLALAERVGVHRSTIYRAKRGQRDPDMETKLAIQKVTGIAPSEFADFYAQVVQARLAAKPQKKSVRAEAAA